MSNHFVLPGQKAWRALPDKYCCPPAPRPFFVSEKHPEQPDGGSDWASSRQSRDSIALKVGNPHWNPQKWQFYRVQHSLHLNWGFLQLNTRSGHHFSQFRVKLAVQCRVQWRIWGPGGGGSEKLQTINSSPYSPLIYFSIRLTRCSCVALHVCMRHSCSGFSRWSHEMEVICYPLPSGL